MVSISCGRGLSVRFAVSLCLTVATAFAQSYRISTVAGGSGPATPAAATSVAIGQPHRLAADAAGNVYFGSMNSVFKLDTKGVLTVVAGNSRPGFSGDGGPATSAQLNGPEGLAVDSAGNLYIADADNDVVRMVTPGGIISTVAGVRITGYSGDGGAATEARLSHPSGLAVDKSGNLYIADMENHAIRQVTPGGLIGTIAGSGYPGAGGNGAPATASSLAMPYDVAVDSSGNIYILESGNADVRKITTDGNIAVYAGHGTSSPGDGGPATAASLAEPIAIALDSTGNLYITEYYGARVRKVSADGTISTLAGTGTSGSTGTQTLLGGPWGLAVAPDNSIYVADLPNYVIRQIGSSGTINTVAGNGLFSYAGDGGAAANAQFNGPSGVARDAAGNVYVSDTRNSRVRKIGIDGSITTLAGTGVGGYGGDSGPGAAAQLNLPRGVATDAQGNVYIADTRNNRVRMISAGGNITTVAGTGDAGYSGDGGSATGAHLHGPFGVAVDATGNLYITEFYSSVVRMVTPGGVISTIAGNGYSGYSGDGGQAAQAQLNAPQGVAVDSSGNVFIADTRNNVVREVLAGGLIQTVAGTGMPGHSGDGGLATQAQLASPSGVAADAAGNLFIAGPGSRVRRVSPDGVIRTIAGTGQQGYSGDGGPAALALLNIPGGISLDASGNLYVADAGNNSVRVLQPLPSTTAIQSVVNGASNLPGAISPGELVVIYGSALGPDMLAGIQYDSNGQVTTTLAGTSVLINGAPVPILYSWSTQVAALVQTLAGQTAQIAVQYAGHTSAPVTVQVASTAPGLYTAGGAGTGQASAINRNSSVNSPARPAAAGQSITLYATGMDAISPVTVTIDGQAEQPQSVGAVPGELGVFQITAQIPSATRPIASVPVSITVGGNTSQPGVTIAVGAQVTLSTTRLIFSSEKVGTASSVGAIAVTNLGGTAIAFSGSGIALAGAAAGDFTIAFNTCGSSVPAGTSCTIGLTFKPTATGTRVATLDVSYSGSGSPQTIVLTGTGT